MRYLSFIAALLLAFAPISAYAVASIGDTLNRPLRHAAGNSDSLTYTIPSGSNQTLYVLVNEGSDNTITGTQNGTTINFQELGTTCQTSGFQWIGTTTAPTSGTLATNSSGNGYDWIYFTANGSSQTKPTDATICTHVAAVNDAVSITPPSANDFLIDWLFTGQANTGVSHGSGQTEYANFDDSANISSSYDSFVNGSSTPSTLQGMSENFSGVRSVDFNIVAIKASAAAPVSTPAMIPSFRLL